MPKTSKPKQKTNFDKSRTTLPPLGSAALKPIKTTGDLARRMHGERALEGFKKLMDNMQQDGDFAPFVIGKHNGQVVMTQLEAKDGKYVLPEFKAPSKEDMKKKRTWVDDIVKRIRVSLHQDIESVVTTALLRKKDEEIKQLHERVAIMCIGILRTAVLLEQCRISLNHSIRIMKGRR